MKLIEDGRLLGASTIYERHFESRWKSTKKIGSEVVFVMRLLVRQKKGVKATACSTL